MLIDKSCLLAENTELANPEHTVIDLGEKGMGTGGYINLFIEMVASAAGLTSATWKFYTAYDKDGTLEKTEILSTPLLTAEKLKKGYIFEVPIPITEQRYLILEIEKDGTATAGRYWAGLTTSEQFGHHNRAQN